LFEPGLDLRELEQLCRWGGWVYEESCIGDFSFIVHVPTQ
jgi:hypothetical protein